MAYLSGGFVAARIVFSREGQHPPGGTVIFPNRQVQSQQESAFFPIRLRNILF